LDVKLGDFGNALFVQPLHQENSETLSQTLPTSVGIGRGTDAYTAPEIFKSSGTYDASVDIYSFGVSLFTIGLSGGRQPFVVTVNLDSSPTTPFTAMNSASSSVALEGLHMIRWIKKGFWHWVEKEYILAPSVSLETQRTPISETVTKERGGNGALSDIFKFPNGDRILQDAVDLLQLCTEITSNLRPTAPQLLAILEELDP
jgi:serine/threonine protein kinase